MKYKSVVEGKGGIVARVVADSVYQKSEDECHSIMTFELEYPRLIHGELMTHRVFSRNGSSSRAIPVKQVIEQVRRNPALPITYGKNQPGMQAKESLTGFKLSVVKFLWKRASRCAATIASGMLWAGLHKQYANRILETFQFMKVVVTSTEWNNWYWLRDHPDAQPEIAELARCMRKAAAESESHPLQNGDWHTPYFGDGYYKQGVSNGTCSEALKISSSCCAQVSYRLLDDTLDKALAVYDKLVESEPVHASPFEHQATPIINTDDPGVTHIDVEGGVWSGNFNGWVQHRQLIKNNVRK